MKRLVPVLFLLSAMISVLSCEEKTDPTKVTGVSLNKATLTLEKGTTETLVATVRPSTAVNKEVTWSSNDISVAAVNASGMVTAVNIGEATIKVVTVKGGYEAKCKVIVTAATPTTHPVTSVTMSPTTLTLMEGNTATLTATVNPPDADDKNVVWSSTNSAAAKVDQSGLVTAVKEGTATIKATCGGKYGYCQVTVTPKVPVPATAVDLGLPSGLKWASYNVGAYSIEELGDYFAWGEVDTYYEDGHGRDNPCEYWKSGKSGYNWSSYKWCSGTSNTLTKYNTSSNYGPVDNIKELQRGENSGETVDDVARFLWKGNWRMPTRADFEELLNNCEKERTTYSGVDGWKFISKTNAANWIFLPYAGQRNKESWYGLMGYWSSSIHSNANYPSYASCLYFNSSQSEVDRGIYLTYSERVWGLSVRPVTK